MKQRLTFLAGIIITVLSSCYLAPPEEMVSGHIKLTCREYLSSGDKEASGYGGYSYVIFPREPSSDEERYRYSELHRAYIRGLTPVREHAHLDSIARLRINITYWPLTISVAQTDSLRRVNRLDSLFVARYDYARAARIIAVIGGFPSHNGPFLVCHKYPLDDLSRDVSCDDVLVYDLTNIRPEFFPRVMANFEERVKNDPAVGSGCGYADKMSRLGSFLRTDIPDIDWDLVNRLFDVVQNFSRLY